MIGHPLNKLLFLDIETCPIVEDFIQLPDRLGDIWLKKHGDECSPSESFEELAGFQAEFSRVVCVGVGFFFTEPDKKEQKFKVMALTGEEEDILSRLESMMNKLPGYRLCGWNIKSFDTPFLCKRYLIGGKSIPTMINHSGKKPWEIYDVDLMELWKFGSFAVKNTSLDLVTAVMGIDSPKDGVDGSKVKEMFYNGKIDDIASYCMRDVVATARVAQKFNGLVPVSDENVVEA
jgi:predicted PolB exonuclease-like 3'-5' exonuclease